MYVCMCVCIYVCIYVCLYVCIFTRMYVCMYVCMYMCVCPVKICKFSRSSMVSSLSYVGMVIEERAKQNLKA